MRRLGTVPYAEALALQRALVEERRADRVPDLLLLLQHPPVITLGVKGDGGRANIVATSERLAELGVEVSETGRGGDVTYHGPGQIVGYPILDLKPDRCDVHRYVRDLEEVMIRVCADYGVAAGRIKGLTGTWVGDEKIGAIGVRISRWITSHGFAFNVTHRTSTLPADRALRHRRPRRDVARSGDRPPPADRRGGGRRRSALRRGVRACGDVAGRSAGTDGGPETCVISASATPRPARGHFDPHAVPGHDVADLRGAPSSASTSPLTDCTLGARA